MWLQIFKTPIQLYSQFALFFLTQLFMSYETLDYYSSLHCKDSVNRWLYNDSCKLVVWVMLTVAYTGSKVFIWYAFLVSEMNEHFWRQKW